MVFVVIYKMTEMSNVNKNYKYCIVPKCGSTSVKTPDKLFISLPSDIKARKLWQESMGRKGFVSSKGSKYCCEDHFNLEEDVENYMYLKTMKCGKVKLKRGIGPHIFKCQEKKSFDENLKPIFLSVRRENTKFDSDNADAAIDVTPSTGPLCKTRWNNIRDSFRKYLKKNVTNSGKITKRYKYAEQLNFLKNHFNETEIRTIKEFDETNRESGEIVFADERSDSSDQREPDLAVESQETIEDRNAKAQETNNQGNKWPASIQRTKKRLKHKQNSTLKSRVSKRKVTYSQPTASAQLMEYLIAKNETQRATTTQPHPVDAFLTGIMPALKLLSPLNFHFAKSEIFAVVQKYELKSLEQQMMQGMNYNDAQQQRQFRNATATALPKGSPSSSCQYSPTLNTPIGSPECKLPSIPILIHHTMDER